MTPLYVEIAARAVVKDENLQPGQRVEVISNITMQQGDYEMTYLLEVTEFGTLNLIGSKLTKCSSTS